MGSEQPAATHWETADQWEPPFPLLQTEPLIYHITVSLRLVFIYISPRPSLASRNSIKC